MQELVKVTIDQNNQQVISARELHKFLEVKERFSNWFERLKQFGFIDGVDFTGVKILTPVNNGGKQKLQDYALTINTAKEIAMVQRSDKGKEARLYFIECEKQLKKSIVQPSYQIEDPIARAEAWIAEKKINLELEESNKRLQFRSDFVDVCFETDGLFSMEQTAKILKLPFGRNTMLKKLRELGMFLGSNTPKQNLINSGYFKVVESLVERGSFKQLVTTTYATQKGIGLIHKKINLAN